MKAGEYAAYKAFKSGFAVAPMTTLAVGGIALIAYAIYEGTK